MKPADSNVLDERQDFIIYNKKNAQKKSTFQCDQNSTSGAVSQRACVYCGARVVLNPITDAVHIVHGPIGCASYTWDIRGSLSSDKEFYRNSYSTDLRERDIIFGGEKKLSKAIEEIMETQKEAKVIFVYATCVVGVIGDDLGAVARQAEEKYGIRVIPVQSSGFAGNKSSGYKAGCDAILDLMTGKPVSENVVLSETDKDPLAFNFLGDFNLAGETWLLKRYFKEMGVKLITAITGDSTCESLQKALNASFNIIQCAGSMNYLATHMKDKYGIPYAKTSFYGLDDIMDSLRTIAALTKSDVVIARTEKLIEREMAQTKFALNPYRQRIKGKTVAIYVGGGFKAISLIKQFNDLGLRSVMVGTQTGQKGEYDTIQEISDEGTVILDDANPSELEKFIREKGADLLVGGVKERPLAYKLGVAFIDHNHERKHPLCGFEGAVNFAKEVDVTLNSPVWAYINEALSEAFDVDLESTVEFAEEA
jgi:nitrogenase molybdenum-cofactor synthesis protein NifE